jgi:hypothetical protein
MAHWPYNTPQWVRLRKVKLQQQPLCEVCMKRGRLVRANTVDHIVSINAAHTRTEAQRWLGDPPAGRSALAAKR